MKELGFFRFTEFVFANMVIFIRYNSKEYVYKLTNFHQISSDDLNRFLNGALNMNESWRFVDGNGQPIFLYQIKIGQVLHATNAKIEEEK